MGRIFPGRIKACKAFAVFSICEVTGDIIWHIETGRILELNIESRGVGSLKSEDANSSQAVDRLDGGWLISRAIEACGKTGRRRAAVALAAAGGKE